MKVYCMSYFSAFIRHFNAFLRHYYYYDNIILLFTSHIRPYGKKPQLCCAKDQELVQIFQQGDVVFAAPCCSSCQGARCGEGLRFRNVSCFVSDGSRGQEGSLVDDELCGDQEPSVDGDTNIVLQEACTVPCPGGRTPDDQHHTQSVSPLTHPGL